MRKAVIHLDEGTKKQGTVVNIIEYNEVSGVALHLAHNHVIWDCTRYEVNMGDRWIDGVFYRENEPISPQKTTADEITQLRLELALINSAVINLMDIGVGGDA